MSDKKYSENDPERTLITLDQLSQTIEVMTSVVNRLRQHLSQQITAKKEIEQMENAQQKLPGNKMQETSRKQHQDSVVVEVSHQDSDPEEAGEEKTLH